MNRIAIADGHAHVFKEHAAEKIIRSFTEYNKMEPTAVGTGTVGGVLDNMREHRIKHTVLANFAPLKTILEINDWTLSVCAEHKELIPLISVHPEMPDLKGAVEKYFKKGAKGVKMHTGIQAFEPADSRLEPVYRFCDENKIPITFHCGETSRVHVNDLADMNHIRPVLESYHRIPFILTHMAGGRPDDVYEAADSCKNAYFDTSITVTGKHCIKRIHDDHWEHDEKTAETFRDIGCNRIVFGSDFPFGDPGSDIERIMRLNLTEKEKRMILGENTLKIYGLL